MVARKLAIFLNPSHVMGNGRVGYIPPTLPKDEHFLSPKRPETGIIDKFSSETFWEA